MDRPRGPDHGGKSVSARHARDDAIDTAHPARAFLALASIALGVPVAVILDGHGGALLSGLE